MEWDAYAIAFHVNLRWLSFIEEKDNVYLHPPRLCISDQMLAKNVDIYQFNVDGAYNEMSKGPLPLELKAQFLYYLLISL